MSLTYTIAVVGPLTWCLYSTEIEEIAGDAWAYLTRHRRTR